MRGLAAENLLPGKGGDIELVPGKLHRKGRRCCIADRQPLPFFGDEIAIRNPDAAGGAIPGKYHVSGKSTRDRSGSSPYGARWVTASSRNCVVMSVSQPLPNASQAMTSTRRWPSSDHIAISTAPVSEPGTMPIRNSSGMPRISRVRSMTWPSLALPSGERCDRPVTARDRPPGVQEAVLHRGLTKIVDVSAGHPAVANVPCYPSRYSLLVGEEWPGTPSIASGWPRQPRGRIRCGYRRRRPGPGTRRQHARAARPGRICRRHHARSRRNSHPGQIARACRSPCRQHRNRRPSARRLHWRSGWLICERWSRSINQPVAASVTPGRTARHGSDWRPNLPCRFPEIHGPAQDRCRQHVKAATDAAFGEDRFEVMNRLDSTIRSTGNRAGDWRSHMGQFTVAIWGSIPPARAGHDIFCLPGGSRVSVGSSLG